MQVINYRTHEVENLTDEQFKKLDIFDRAFIRMGRYEQVKLLINEGYLKASMIMED